MTDTHKNYWECETGIAYIVSRPKGWRARIVEVFDLSDPSNPVKIRDFGLPGQQPGATGAVPVDRSRAGFDRREGQPRLSRLRHQPRRHPADRRPREALEGGEGADAGEPALSGDRQAGNEPDGRRAHRDAARPDQDPGVRQGRRQGRPRVRDDRQRDVPRGMRRSPPDGVVRRLHHREASDGGVELDSAGGERELLHAWRTIRRAFLERGHGSALLSEVDFHHLLQCRRPGARRPQSVSSRRRSAISFRRSARRRCSVAA